MANRGWYGTEEEWSRIEAPLKALDSDLARFALKHDTGKRQPETLDFAGKLAVRP
jgi:hypothetical protein